MSKPQVSFETTLNEKLKKTYIVLHQFELPKRCAFLARYIKEKSSFKDFKGFFFFFAFMKNFSWDYLISDMIRFNVCEIEAEAISETWNGLLSHKNCYWMCQSHNIYYFGENI